MRPALLPPSSDSTVPMAISWMTEGSRFGLAARVALRAAERSSSGYASLRWPLLERVMGVRREERITMSEGCFERIFLRPRGAREAIVLVIALRELAG